MDEDKIITTLIDHGERLDRIEQNMATKADVSGIHKTLDEILGVVKKNDQEMTMMGSRVKRIEKKIEEHDKDIQQIKPLVGLPGTA